MVVFISSYLLLQVGSDNRQLVFLYERGKKKLMDGTRMVFPSKHFLQFLCSFICADKAYLFDIYASVLKLMQMKKIHPQSLGGLSSVLGISRSSVGSACVLDPTNRLRMISIHIARLILLYPALF
jgi:hypothetical protein